MKTGFRSTPKLLIVWLSALCLVLTVVSPVLAAPTYKTRVKVIHAGRGDALVDPGLEAIAREIRSEFNYTRFKYVNQADMALAEGEKGRVSLPGNRALVITPVGSSGNRIQYHIRINAGGRPVFQTGVRLRDGASVTIGGPKMNKGVILINIQGHTR